MKEPQISICIPIYNCGEFIGEALDSICQQLDEHIEVIVYDGGSTDNTPKLMSSHCEKFSCIRYVRSSVRGGIDADLVSCVSHARGEWLWLFSGDDVMRQGAISRVREWIRLESDILICKHSLCTRAMEFIAEYPVISPDVSHRADLADHEQRIDWFKRAATSEAFFSFISGLVVKATVWRRGTLPKEFDGSCWGHVARFFALIPSGLTVQFVSETWLDKRGDNDSFSDKGLVNRYRIGIEGYNQLATHFFGHHSEEARNVRRIVRSEFPLTSFLALKIICLKNPATESKKMLDKIFKMAYQDGGLNSVVARVVFMATPYLLLKLARVMYQPVKKLKLVLRNG